MGTLWPHSNLIEWDANGDRAEGALARFYDAGTSTPRVVYQDAALDTPHTQPVEADGNGRWPEVFLQFGTFKETITTAGGTQLWTTDNIPNPEPFDESFELDTTAIYNTGDYIFAGANTSRSGAVRCNGKTIGNAASGATERANADTSALFTYLWNNYANGQLAVSTGRGASAAADYAANKTIALPNHQSAGLIGFDDMGNTAAGLAASAPVVNGSAILAGSILGANTHVLTEAQLASHTHTGTTATEGAHTHTGTTASDGQHTHTGVTNSDGGHTHTISGGTVGGTGNITGVLLSGGGATVLPTGAVNIQTVADGVHTHAFTTNASSTHTHTFTSAAGSAHSHTFTSAATGSSTAHNNLGRITPVTILMKL